MKKINLSLVVLALLITSTFSTAMAQYRMSSEWKTVKPFPSTNTPGAWQGAFMTSTFGSAPKDQFELRHIKNTLRKVLKQLPEFHHQTLEQIKIQKRHHPSRGRANGEKIIFDTTKIDDYQELIAVAVHEMGHVVDLGVLEGKSWQISRFRDGPKRIKADDPSVKFYEISWYNTKQRRPQQKKDFVSGYAMTTPFEDFAESYLMYRLHGEKFRNMMVKSTALQTKYQYMKTYVFAGQEYQKDKEATLQRSFYDATLLPFENRDFLVQRP